MAWNPWRLSDPWKLRAVRIYETRPDEIDVDETKFMVRAVAAFFLCSALFLAVATGYPF